ncbi:hypothetical protein HG535_0F05570 [Zygotorulaspora mrakii]|uniref:Anaphase spindle elongation protein n=1 Tax=Zygotorulaspora mrakii TaxID=42260 RepID=A0A7H9B5S1_ZYGMR|nr:uncharacterized protein HG535_0F05570 [Zygotorulaspora mrakii]QLG74045.1 hypothetical protein HG535_0F05570 [Zygotorulaspora mrakii]
MRQLSTGTSSGTSPTSNCSLASDTLKLSDYNSSGMKTETTTTALTTTKSIATTADILAASLNTPSLNKRIDTFCYTKDCMKLTPVNIKTLASPIRHPRHEVNQNISERISADDTYKENFGLIARQLEKLLESLNIVFRQIGYSNSEIVSKEKMIFNTLSDSITKFSYQAESELKTLAQHNDFDQDILNRILEIIDDSTGIDSISDLYVRNAILVPKNKPFVTSPKKPLSLLSKKKLLHSGKKFVLNAYIPKLLEFLNHSIQFQLLYNAVNESLKDLRDPKILTSLPPLKLAVHLKNILRDSQNDIDAVTRLIKNYKDELLAGRYFNDLSKEMNELIADSIKLYEVEYKNRLGKITSMSRTISDLFKKLHVDTENEVDPQIKDLLVVYSTNNHSGKNDFLPVHKNITERLESTLKEYQVAFGKRVENRDILLSKCRSLWYKLNVPDDYVNNFLSENSTLSSVVLMRFANELEKLENMKKKVIKTLINDALRKIEGLWETLQSEAQERTEFLRKFDSMKSTSINLEDDERLLGLCENEIKGLEEKLAIYMPVLKLIEEFKQLQADKGSLEKSSKDSSRLLLRNSHKILLQEEKTRKRITRHFPRIIQDLKLGLSRIEEMSGKPLYIDGENLNEMVVKQEEELLTRYPRSRVNRGARKPQISSASKPAAKRYQPEQKRLRRNASFSFSYREDTSAIDLNQTPATRLNSVNKSDRDTTGSTDSDSSSIKYTQEVRFSSPVKPFTKLLPPTYIARRSESKIPEPKVKNLNSLSLVPSPVFRPRNSAPKNEIVRPTRLFPISSNKINQNKTYQANQFEELMKQGTVLSNEQINEPAGKENVVNSTPKFLHASTKDAFHFSSPYRESNNSVYKLSMSPEGKCTLNVQESGLTSGVDDTSFVDDENDKYYDTWKKEQILKLKNFNT